jgi:ACS family allantoate permease-like MFS transporter
MSEKEKFESEVLEPIVSFTQDNIGTLDVITSFTSAGGKVVNVTGDVDEAMKIALNIDGVVLDKATNKRILRKIDIYLLPLICMLYAFQFMDKTTTSYAAVMGFQTYFHMVGDMYSWCGTAFYLGYLVFVFPANAILQRFPLAKTTSAFIVLWGIILCLHAAPKTYAGIITLRTILGMLESAVTPSMVIFTSQWYRAEEHFLRTAFWFACNGLGIIIGGAIAYGVAVHEAHYSIEAWKVLFIITGLITIATGVLFFLHIPDYPSEAWFLNDEETELVVERIRTNQQGFGNRHFKMYQFKEAMLDLNTWLYFFFGIASNIPNGALTNFGSILLHSDFGFSSKESLLMNMPCGAVEFVGCILFAASHSFIPHRMAISLMAMTIALAASCMLAFAGPRNVRLAGYYLMYVYPVTTICALSCFASNTAGHTKKITTNAIFLIGYCIGNIVGPQTFVSKQAPSYTGGKISFVVCDCVTLCIIGAIYLNYWISNRKKEKDMAALKDDPLTKLENYEFADMTDKENPHFRYRL